MKLCIVLAVVTILVGLFYLRLANKDSDNANKALAQLSATDKTVAATVLSDGINHLRSAGVVLVLVGLLLIAFKLRKQIKSN